MSNRPKVKKPKMTQAEQEKLFKELDKNEDFKGMLEKMTKMINERLDRCSPGAHFERGEEIGTFFIITPNQKLPVDSLNVLGMMTDYVTSVGEQALIQLIERVNKFAPLYFSWQEPIPAEQKMSPDEFVIAMETGIDLKLRRELDWQMKLPDAEGAILGAATAQMLIDFLKPFKCNIAASGERSPMVLNMPGERYPIGSPTVFAFILQRITLKNTEDIKSALAITNLIVATHPLFPEFRQGGGIAVSEN